MWRNLPCKRKDLQLAYTLCGGQSFRWKKTGDEEWTGVFSQCIWTLSRTNDCLMYQVIPASQIGSINLNHEELLRQYLRLDVNLDKYYDSWSTSDLNFKDAAVKFHGLRILMQDPIENLFAFICSSNNNIARISSMVEKLCVLYGTPIGKLNGETYHSFPCVSALTGPSVEKTLRNAGFGYRAKFIHQSACKIVEMGGSDWLEGLKRVSYIESKAALMKLPGIGAKVADCICLMSLGHLEAIPVDTHIFKVATEKYLPHLKNCKSVTDRVYNEIGDHFRGLYGSYAGWAHTILFCADLKMFQEKTPKSPKRKSKEKSDCTTKPKKNRKN